MSAPPTARLPGVVPAPQSARNSGAYAAQSKADRLGSQAQGVSGVLSAAHAQARGSVKGGAGGPGASSRHSPRVANPRAIAGMLRPLDHVGEVRVVAAPPPAPHAPYSDPLLSALQNGPAMPAFPTHGPEPLHMREVERRAAFEGGTVGSAEAEERRVREVARRAAFEGGVVGGSGPAPMPADPARREPFQGAVPPAAENDEEARRWGAFKADCATSVTAAPALASAESSHASAAASAAVADTHINIVQPAATTVASDASEASPAAQEPDHSASNSDAPSSSSGDRQPDAAPESPGPADDDSTRTSELESGAQDATAAAPPATSHTEAPAEAPAETQVEETAKSAAEAEAESQAEAQKLAARQQALALEVEQMKAAQASERAAAAAAAQRAQEEAAAVALEAQRAREAKEASIAAEVAAERARIDAERAEVAEEARRAKVEAEEAETARQLAECEAQLAASAGRKRVAAAEVEAKAAADAAVQKAAAEAERLRVEAERAQRERDERQRMERELAEMESARLALVAQRQQRIAAEQAQAEEQLRAALAAESARLESEADQKARELVEASRYIFRAEALPNSYCDFGMKLSCRFDPKPFQTTAFQAAFAIAGASNVVVGGGVSNGNTNNSKRGSGGFSGGSLLSTTSLRPYVELLCLRSNKTMVSKAVWTQILAGEAEEAKPGHVKNEGVVRVGDNVWLVADRAEPVRVTVSASASSSSAASLPASMSHTVELELKDVLSKIESLCHNEYLRPVLIRVLSRRPPRSSSSAAPGESGPVLLGEVMTTLRALESSVVGNKPADDPNGPVRTVEAPFDLMLPPAAPAAAAASSAGPAGPVRVGTCLVTRAQELIHQPFAKLQESMESKRSSSKKKSGSSSSLLFPRRCKMQLMLSCNNLVNATGPLHVCCVLYRAEKEEKEEKDDKEEEEKDDDATAASTPATPAPAPSDRLHAPPTSLSSRVLYDGKKWTEFSRTNTVSFDEHPGFERVALELDEASRRAKTPLLLLVYNAAYLGGSVGSGSAPPPVLAPEGVDLERCQLLGGCTTSLLHMCAASGVPSAASTRAAVRNLAADAKKRNKGKRGSDGAEMALGGVMCVNLHDLHAGGVRLVQQQRASAAARGPLLGVGAAPPPSVALELVESGPVEVVPSLTLSRVSLFVPSTQLEDVERASGKRARQLTKLADAARAAQERAVQELGRCEEERGQVRVDMQHKRAEMEAELRTKHLQAKE